MVKYFQSPQYVPGLQDYAETINMERMRRERAERARQVLKEHGLPAILVTYAPNVRYLTGFVHGATAQLDYVLFFAEGDPVLFAHAGFYQAQPSLMPWIKHWRIGRSWLSEICGPDASQKEAKLFAQEIFQELRERGLTREKLGVVCFDERAQRALREAGLTLVDAWPLMLEMSKTKTQDEVACLKVATSICDVGWRTLMQNAKPGVTTGQLAHTVSKALLEAGAETAPVAVYSGSSPGAVWRGGARNVRINHGDIGYMHLCGTSYMGYTACLYRAFVVGREPNAKEKGMYKRLLDTLNGAIDATRVGNTTADAAKAFPAASTRGCKDEAEVLTVEFGHGIGIVAYPPALVAYNLPNVNRQWSFDFPQPFEKGMVVAYETLEGVPGYGALRLETDVVITDQGAEIIDTFPRDELLVAGV
ncbi:MAG: aminopeptidase P family protein [Chloroflexi bacterium]|nr:aminopeptidase P family protein [Chloroflexota bacterium]